MKFHIITIFPEAFTSFLSTSIIGKAIEKGLLEITLYKLNDFSPNTSGHVDEKAYGMHGQVLAPEPLACALDYVFSEVGGTLPVVYFTPRGELFSQTLAESYSHNPDSEYILLCGHYEGIDERILELYNIIPISIGNYILTGGELPTQIFIDAITRLIPGVLGNSLSHEEESFSEKLGRQREYPVYTRPQNFRGLEVPDVLLSGNHEAIEIWKKKNLLKP